LVSGWGFTVSQFNEFWPFIVALASGFGIQVALFLRLRQLTADHHHTNQIVAASGKTSTVAMLACHTHYLANVLPVLGAVGLVSIVAQYQVQLLWIGLIFNTAGLAYIIWQFSAAKRAFKEMHRRGYIRFARHLRLRMPVEETLCQTHILRKSF
jgi:P-type Cu+ transporter